MTLTILTMSNGHGIDLLNPKASDIDFKVIAEHLAKANRYCGATLGISYSVAEHSVRCADAAFQSTGDKDMAKYLLCHDMHEAYLGDDTTPKKRAIAEIAAASFGTLAVNVMSAFNAVTDRFDIAIHEAAGLPWPPPENLVPQIKHFDRVLLATEWRDLMQCEPPYDFGVDPLPAVIKPAAHWESARNVLLLSIRDLLGVNP